MPSRSRLNLHAIKFPKGRDLAELLQKFETEDICSTENEKTGNAAQQHSKDGRRVARRLLTCVRERGEMCGSGACRRCLRQFRREFYVSASRVSDPFRSHDGSYGLVVSVIPGGLRAAPGQLHRLDLRAIAGSMWRAVHSMAWSYPIIGGIDVSYNEDARHIVAPHWQVHFAFVVLGAPSDPAAQPYMRKRIEAAFTLEPSAKRPLHIQVVEDQPRQLSYLFKSSFARRVSVIAANGRSNTLARPLKNRERVELALWLDSYPATTRLVLNGIRRRGLTLNLNSDLLPRGQK